MRGGEALWTNGPGVQHEMLVMRSLLSNEADTMSAMRHHMNKAMTAMWAEKHFFENIDILERRTHERYKQVVQALFCTTGDMVLDEGAGRHAPWLSEPMPENDGHDKME